MSCAYFAKEVSYLIRAPIYNPPMFLISKYHAQTTWSGQPAVARLQLVESIFFLVVSFFVFLLCELSIGVSSLLQHHSALGATKRSTWSWRSLVIWTQRERAVLCFQSPKSWCCRGRAQTWGRGELLLVQCRGDPDRLLASAPLHWHPSTFLILSCDTTWCTLHQKSRVILRASRWDESFGKQAAAVHCSAPYMSSGWNAGWVEGREGTILSFFPNKKCYRKRIQHTVHLTNFLTDSHCNVLSRIRRNKVRGRIINPECLFASYNHIIMERV